VRTVFVDVISNEGAPSFRGLCERVGITNANTIALWQSRSEFPTLATNARMGHSQSEVIFWLAGNCPHARKPALRMQKWHKVFLLVLALWVIFMVVMSPRFIEATHQKKEVDRVFFEYTRALLDQRWNDAYTVSGDDFRLRTTPQTFVNQHQELIREFGKLQSIKQGHTVVEEKGTPPIWAAEIHAEFEFDTKPVRLVYWFRFTDGHWRLVGYRLE
jgi:hypothetical protein